MSVFDDSFVTPWAPWREEMTDGAYGRVIPDADYPGVALTHLLVTAPVFSLLMHDCLFLSSYHPAMIASGGPRDPGDAQGHQFGCIARCHGRAAGELKRLLHYAPLMPCVRARS